MSIEILRSERAKCHDKLRVVMLAPIEADDALAEYDALKTAHDEAQTVKKYDLERIRELRRLIDDLTDPDDCQFDHHGYCQAHGWMATEPKCPHARAKQILEGK